MSLSSDLISKFVKATKDNKKTKTETTVYGTVKEYNDELYVQLDGSELLTPFSTTADMKNGERVMVQIKNHTATVIGNISSPAARTDDVKNMNNEVIEVKKVIAQKVDTEVFKAAEARINDLETENIDVKGRLTAAEGDIKNLKADSLTANDAAIKYATIESLDATNAEIDDLKTTKLDAAIADIKYATIESLNSTNADIKSLQATKLDASVAEITYATIDDLNAANADIEKLQTNKLDATSADIKYANIDFANINMTSVETLFSKSGIIKDLVVDDTKITGELVGVTIKGDLIEGNTVVADKLVVKGTDGLYYKLNTDGIKTEAEQTEYNSLNGSIITTKTITASKIAVDDLVAFDATIGGFKITENSIYSGAKTSATNTTTGVYLGDDGQMAVGDATNFIKYYKDQNGNYKLEISADSVLLSSENKSIETVLDEVSEATQTNANDLANYISTTNNELENLQGQIDGSIATWFYEYVPTNTNVPASEWATTAVKNNHLGDLFYDTITGYCYRWQVQNNVYSWNRITDVDVTKALADAAAAQNTADQAKESIDNLSIGGRNLIIQHAFAHEDCRLSNIVGAVDYMYVDAGYVITSKIYVTPGEQYTLSAQDEITGYLSLGYFTEDNTYLRRPIMYTDFSQKCTDVITIPDNVVYCRISFNKADKDFIKFEKGNKATDWTLAPEDADNNLSLLESRVTLAETSITQNSNALLLKAEKTEVTTAKAEAISSANSNTVNLLKDYSTTAEMTAAIQLKAESITSSVSADTSALGKRISTVEQTATGLTTRLGTAENNITTAQNAANKAQDDINNLSIGARNLIVRSAETQNKWISTSGVVEECSLSYKNAVSPYIEVTPSTKYVFSRKESTASDGGFFRYAWYDENQTYISRAAHSDLEKLVTSPSNAVYIRVAYPYDSYPKFEKGSKATDWTPAPEDVDGKINIVETRVTTAENNITTAQNTANTAISNAADAAKTATNYLNFSTSGLVIGDMTASTLGENVLIDSNSVDIREGTTTLASFGASTIYLGKNSETSVINLCNGAATMRVKDNTDFRIYTDKRLVMSAYDSMLLDCWRDSTHMTRIAIQSSDPDVSSVVGGVQFTIYQDSIENTVKMLGNDIELKVTNGTNTSRVTMDETIYKVYTTGKIHLNGKTGVQVSESSSYAASLTIGYTYTQAKSINIYWSDGSTHDLIGNSNGQTSYFGPADIDEATTTNVRGKNVRLYAHEGGGVYLGYSGSTAITSDRNMKTDILDIDDKYINFFDRLRPITYKYDCPGNKGHRDHVGFIAQEVEEALTASGLTTEQFAGLVIEQDVTLNPNYDSSLTDEENLANETHYDTLYSLRYEEFISLLVKKVQNLQTQINDLERRLS